MYMEQVGIPSRVVIASTPMRKLTTAEVILEYLIREDRAGHINRPKLAKQMGISQSMMGQLMNRQRDFAMRRLDQTAEFFRMLPEEFIAHARREIQPQETQRDTSGNTSSSSTAGERFRRAR